jgi:hypothetical protein
MIVERPTHDLAREGVDHHREIDEGLGQPDVSPDECCAFA